MSDLLIEKKHMDMMKYAMNKINQLPKKERVLADMMRDRMYRAWELIGQQQWRKDEPEFNTEPQNPAHLRRGGLRFLRIPDLDNTYLATKAQRVANAPAYEKAVQNVSA